MLAGLLWTATPKLYYLECAGAYFTTREFRRKIRIKPKRKISTEWGTLDTDGRLTIFARYLWDGASGPTIDTPDAIMASLVHDFLYQLIRTYYLSAKDKEAADMEFYEILQEQGMFPPRAFAWWRGVVRGGHSSILPENERREQCVPRDAEPVRTYSPIPGFTLAK